MIKIYTDGAYSSLRDQGGWACVVVENGIKKHSFYGDAIKTTNNRMEIQGALEALIYARENKLDNFTVLTDSMYVIGTMTLNWKKKKNLDLWIKMEELKQGLTINWEHVKGHNGDTFNEVCDMLASHASHIQQ